MPVSGYRKYAPEQLAMLSQLYGQMTLREAAERVGMTYEAAFWQARQLGLRKSFSQIVKLNPVTASSEHLSYLAGLIDGEGTVSIRKFSGKFKPCIRVANTSWPLMEWLRETFDGPSVFIEHRLIRASRLQCYMFHFQGLGHLPLYEALAPRLVIKRAQMECLVEFSRERLGQHRMESLSARQMELVSTVRDLNIPPSRRSRAASSEISPSTT
jgi:hypothetical protein